jgi:hypothetical protein
VVLFEKLQNFDAAGTPIDVVAKRDQIASAVLGAEDVAVEPTHQRQQVRQLAVRIADRTDGLVLG